MATFPTNVLCNYFVKIDFRVKSVRQIDRRIFRWIVQNRCGHSSVKGENEKAAAVRLNSWYSSGLNVSGKHHR